MVPDQSGINDDPGGTHHPVFKIKGEGFVEVRFRSAAVGKTDRVFHGHAGPLGKILQHRVGCVPQQCHPAIHPIPDRVPITEDPEFPVRSMVDHLLGAGMDVFESLFHLLP